MLRISYMAPVSAYSTLSTAARGEESLTSKEMVLSAPSPVVARFEISGATVSIVKS